MARPVTTEPLRQAITDILRASPLLTVNEIVGELEVGGMAHLMPDEAPQRLKLVYRLLAEMPGTLSIQRVEVVSKPYPIKRFCLVED